MDETLRVLLVEDSDTDAALTQAILAKETDRGETAGIHFEVTRCRRLEDAINLSVAGFDAAILDLILPDSRGLPTLVDFQRGAGTIPTVVLTGSHEPERAIEAILSGAQEFIRKDDMKGLPRAVYFSILRSAASGSMQERLVDAVQRRARDLL